MAEIQQHPISGWQPAPSAGQPPLPATPYPADRARLPQARHSRKPTTN